MNWCKHILLLLLLPMMLIGCRVHQWPEPQEVNKEDFILRLHFNTLMTIWEHYYDINTRQLIAIETDQPVVYDNTQTSGSIRYIVRIYNNNQRNEHIEEHIFSCELTEAGYDFETPMRLPIGDYTIRVWADIRDSLTFEPLYDASDFAQIELTNHLINTDYRDAFCGVSDFSLKQRQTGEQVEVLTLEMNRPKAKFEFVADGLEDFMEQQRTRSTTTNNITDYQVMLVYTGYVPFAYSMLTDEPNNSRFGEQFSSAFSGFNGYSATMCYDYIFARVTESATWVRLGVFDSEGESVAISYPILVPLQRDRHTLIRGRFLEIHASDGFVGLDPSFDGDFNWRL